MALRQLREWMWRLWGTVSRRRHDADLEDELRSHAELALEAAARHGHPPAEARRRLHVQAGGMAQAMDSLRDQRGLPLVDDVTRDVRYAVRSLRRSPVFAAVAILTLGLGIGANAAVFQLLQAIRLQPLPVERPEQLVVLGLADLTRWSGRRTSGYPVLTTALWEEFRSRQRIFAGVTAWANAEFRINDGPADATLRGLFVSGEFFSVLGVTPAVGRTFSAADDRAGCGFPAAVVSHGFWQRHFAGDHAVVGRTVSVNGRRVEIVGVTPPSFFGVEVGRSYDLALPICAHDVVGQEKGWLRDRTTWWLTILGRMAPAQTLAQVNARLDAMSPGVFAATVPIFDAPGAATDYLSLTLKADSARSGVSHLRTRFAEPLTLLMAITGLVMLIVCSNLASLVIARASTRQQEFAVRHSLGASRLRLVRQVLAETFVVAMAGAAVGLALAGTLSRLLIEALGTNVSLAVRTDAALVGTVILSALVAALGLGAVPAWRASRSTALNGLRNTSARGSAAGADGLGIRRGLLIVQVAVSLVLLFGALLFVATLRNLLAADSGFQPEDVIVARMDFSHANVAAGDAPLIKAELLARAIDTPGVGAAAEVRHVPMSGTGSSLDVWPPGSDPSARTTVRLNAVTPGYLRTMGIELVSGRDFTATDSALSPRVAIVNRSFARRLGLEGNPVGTTFRVEGRRTVEIVGLIPDTKYFSLREDPLPIVFVPIAQIPDPRAVADLVIRASVPMEHVVTALRQRVQEVNPSIAVNVRDLESTISEGLVREKLLAGISSFFGALAVVIAAVGLYGVMAELVIRRRREIGLRLALGAQRVDVLVLVIRQTGVLLLGGVACGLLLTLPLSGLARGFVYGVHAGDVPSLALACVTLAVPALLAMLVPAVRAVMRTPLAALRDE